MPCANWPWPKCAKSTTRLTASPLPNRSGLIPRSQHSTWILLSGWPSSEVNCGLFPLQLGFSLQISLNICLVCYAWKWIVGYFLCSWDFPCRSAWIFVWFAMQGSELWVTSLAAGISLVDQLECFCLVCHAGQWIMGCFPSRSYSQTWKLCTEL